LHAPLSAEGAWFRSENERVVREGRVGGRGERKGSERESELRAKEKRLAVRRCRKRRGEGEKEVERAE
jgi:hypothetical protein